MIPPGTLTRTVPFIAVLLCAATLIVPYAVDAATKLGVYKGAGCDGIKGLEKFTAWLGFKPDQTLEFISWQVLSAGTHWGLSCWRDGGQKQVVFSLPMLPDDGSAVLADGAAGKFDELYTRYANLLVRFGFGGATVRIGWEFNGDWYPWAASKDPESYKAYWRRIVKTMRAVPGANFKFDWCMAGGWTSFLPELAYPGDDVVDFIGMDFYNIPISKDTVTPEQIWDSRMNTRRGLKWHRDFARQHGKHMSYPEWGTGLRPDGKGGGDDPYFIEQMALWFANNDVAYHNYWDQITGVNARLSDDHQPLAGAMYKRVFKRNTPIPPVLDKPAT